MILNSSPQLKMPHHTKQQFQSFYLLQNKTTSQTGQVNGVDGGLDHGSPCKSVIDRLSICIHILSFTSTCKRTYFRDHFFMFLNSMTFFFFTIGTYICNFNMCFSLSATNVSSLLYTPAFLIVANIQCHLRISKALDVIQLNRRQNLHLTISTPPPHTHTHSHICMLKSNTCVLATSWKLLKINI